MRKHPPSRRSANLRRALTLEGLEPRQLLAAQPIVTEFMASNQQTLADGDGEFPDWIEIYNAGDQSVDLTGYHLTDDSDNLQRWAFPSVNLGSNEYRIVFASGKGDGNYVDSGGYLHTDFKLSAAGEYVGLVSPAGQVVSEFSTGGRDYPQQLADVAYGVVQGRTLVTGDSPARWWVPLDSHFGTDWTEIAFDDASQKFAEGTASLGYEDRPDDRTNFVGEFATELGNDTHAVYTRIEFDVEDASQITALKLALKYDNGFVAYLNGQRVAADNAPEVLDWYSAAPDGARRDSAAIQFADFDLSEHVDALVTGKNVLAIHGLNNQLRDRSDFLLAPQLFAGITSGDLPIGYLPTPTPGEANISPDAMAGPMISQVTVDPGAIDDQQDLRIVAKLTPLNAPVDTATLTYRVMYDEEVTVPMVDDGTAGDETAGDGVFSAIIPHIASDPGQMVRWMVTAVDTDGNQSRGPDYLNREGSGQSPEYFGTVVADPSVDTQLPLIQWFIESPRSAESGNGTRASFSHDGEFYDNIFVRVRGGTARGWPKKSYKVEFNEGYHFEIHDDLPRVDEINLNATFTDKSYVRTVLTSEMQNDSGTPSPEAFLLRLQQNGEFYSVAILVEQPDKDFLRRHGLDPDGALYKGGPGANLQSMAGLEAKTGTSENRSEARALVDGLKQQGEALERFLYDNVDIPALVNFMATNVISQNIDASDKNYYLYRDTFGSGQWQIMPWDLDLTFGPDALNTDTIIADENRRGARNPNAVHPFLGSRKYTLDGASKFNELQDRIVENPRTQEMLVRRIRSLADQFLATTYFHDRIDEIIAQIAPDVLLDKARWGVNAHFGSRDYTLVDANERIKNEYLAPRLPYLTTRQSELTQRQGGVGIPDAQVGNPMIVFGTIEANPTSGNQDEEFIELVNTNPFSVDLSGWQFSGGISHVFRPGTVIPSGASLYVSPDLRVFRARVDGPSGNQGRFVQGNYDGHLANSGESILLVAADGEIVQRAFIGGQPSTVQDHLRISEINFHPHGPNPIANLKELDTGAPGAADQFEFIELTNTGEQTLDISGVRFSQAIDFTLLPGTSVEPGERVVVVSNVDAFRSRYGTAPKVIGQFTGTLADAGEIIFLDDADGGIIHTFTYSQVGHRPARAEGRGSSLTVSNLDGDYGDPANWNASVQFGGSPGLVEAMPHDRVTINEVAANSDLAQLDMIELRNTGGTSVAIGNWYLSNSNEDYFRFRIPSATDIGPLEYAVFDTTQLGFDLDGSGDDVWLVAGDANGKPLRFVDHIQFGPSEKNVSMGPWPTRDDPWIQLAEPTFGQPNAKPWVGEIVISEVHYSPTDPDRDRPQVPDDFEFIELYNRSAAPIDVSDWQITGDVEFTFPAGTTIGPLETLTLAGIDTTDGRKTNIFRFTLGMPASETVVGPFSPSLDDHAGSIRLLRPLSPSPNDPDTRLWVPIDVAAYQATTPWPGSAAGEGDSLARTDPDDYGLLPISWTASAPSPGVAEFAGRPLAGDANNDGQFNQADIVSVLESGKYKTDQPAAWSEGDWTGDGLFDQFDLVAALLDDRYTQ